MSIKIEKIIIYLDTGIPNIKTSEKEPLKLSRNLIYHPDIKEENNKLSELPFITPSIKYPTGELQKNFKLNGYNNVVRFFFDELYFKNTLFSINRKNKINKNKKIILEPEVISSNLEFNINFMIQMLFPTVFPSKKNIVSSFDEYIEQENNSNFSFDNPFVNNFSYLKIESKTYTITKVTMLDDMINNPFYREVVDSYIKFLNWAEEEEIKIKNNLMIKFKILLEKMTYKDLTNKEKEKISVNIILFITDFQTKYDDINKNNSKYISSSYKNLLDELDLMKINLTNLNSFIDKPDFNPIDIDKINIYNELDELKIIVDSINDTYTKIKNISNVSSSITNESVFKKKLEKLVKEVTELYYYKKIASQYLNKDTSNINYNNEEDSKFIDFIKSKYPNIKTFVDKLDNNIIKNHVTSNPVLKDIIENFYEKKNVSINNPNPTPPIAFNALVQNINDELIEINKKQFFNNTGNRKLIKIGTCFINKNNTELPQYEIYIAFNLLEGLINMENLNSIKCNYRAVYLGQETQNKLENYNAEYDYKYHKIFVPEEKEEAKKEDKKEDKKIAAKGGKKRSKRKIKNNNKTKKIIYRRL